MALTADERALLDRLTAKADVPEEAKPELTLERVVEYLVRTSDKFTANPTDRDDFLAFLDGLINPQNQQAPADAEAN
jgi:hypothetical protein